MHSPKNNDVENNGPTSDARRIALNVLAGAESAALAALWASWSEQPEFTAVRGPETGLVMVRGRAGGGGAPFNLGEATVSRATIRLTSGEIGHGYCLGRDLGKARTIAVFDAIWQQDSAQVETLVIAPLREGAAASAKRKADETAATKVDFFTMVRGDN